MIFIELSKLTPVIPCSEEPISLQILKISLMRSNHLFIYDKELLRKKSSQTSVKANATIGIMGSDSLVFLTDVDSVSRRKSINTLVLGCLLLQ